MSRDLNLLHPMAKLSAEELVKQCKSKGIDILITETWRSRSEQNALYAKGRTTKGRIVTNAKYPKSAHCWGVAFDFCLLKNGKADWNDIIKYKQVGTIGKSLGLFWGGNFRTITDYPHFELPEFLPNNSVTMLISKYDTPEKFKESWTSQKKGDGVKIKQVPVKYVKKGYTEKINAVNIEGNNFVKVRDLCKVLGFEVDYENGVMVIKE